MKRLLIFGVLPALLLGCKASIAPTPVLQTVVYGPPVKVAVLGYFGNIMEPFMARDGRVLLFNNLNAAPENTNLHWATRLTDSTFQYQGEVAGVNTPDLEGVPTLDGSGNLYFVSTRSYAATFSTLYRGAFAGGTATAVQLLGGVSRQQAGWVNFDVEVSADGHNLYYVDARLDQNGTPQSADLVLATNHGSGFQRRADSAELLKNINTPALEYAAGISVNELELYFTRILLPITANTTPTILVATRPTVNDPFGTPLAIASISGFAEAPTVAPDQRTIYFHHKDGNTFQLYLVRKR